MKDLIERWQGTGEVHPELVRELRRRGRGDKDMMMVAARLELEMDGVANLQDIYPGESSKLYHGRTPVMPIPRFSTTYHAQYDAADLYSYRDHNWERPTLPLYDYFPAPRPAREFRGKNVAWDLSDATQVVLVPTDKIRGDTAQLMGPSSHGRTP